MDLSFNKMYYEVTARHSHEKLTVQVLNSEERFEKLMLSENALPCGAKDEKKFCRWRELSTYQT